ncbi:MAG: ABC transporter permease [Deltaproteobacteria bacterium]|nr:ABC transporter permease [Deltaproteobacteria bacterium]
MMPVKNLLGMVIKNTIRSKRHFILSAFGIVIGIGAFVLFLALTQQAGAVLEKVFPLDEVQVVAPRVSLLGKDASKRLDDTTVKMITSRPEVSSAVPRMSLAFPAAGRGDFEGTDLKFEVGGFADGVDPSFVQDDERIQKYFKDWELVKDDPNLVACTPPPRDPKEDIIQSPGKRPVAAAPDEDSGWGPQIPDPNAGSAGSAGSAGGAGSAGSAGSGSGSAMAGSSGDGSGAGAGPAAGSGSGSGSGAGSGSGTAIVVQQTGAPVAKEPYYNPCPEPDRYYCDDTERRCKHRVPIVLSSTVVELYNNQFAKSHGMPMADQNLVNMLIQQRGLSAMRFSVGLGFTTIAGTGVVTRRRPKRVEAVVVGVSSRAMPVGVTMPIEYIRRWNKEYLGEEAAGAYSSIIVKFKDRNQLAPFSEWIETPESAGGPGLRLEDQLGKRFATVIFVIRLLFLIISIAILVIAVINIGHNFFIQVSERRREIGIMRAVGATEMDVRLIMLGEAALIGIVGGLIGLGLAVGIGAGWDYYARNNIPAFPFKPASWFEFKTWIWAGGLGFSTLFCILGGFLPARRAAKMEPAQALAAQ